MSINWILGHKPQHKYESRNKLGSLLTSHFSIHKSILFFNIFYTKRICHNITRKLVANPCDAWKNYWKIIKHAYIKRQFKFIYACKGYIPK